MKISFPFLFIKWCVLASLLFLSNSAYSGDPVNDIKRLRQTVATISESLMTPDNIPPALFVVSQEQFRTIFLNVDENAAEDVVEERFQKFNKRVQERYARLKRDVSEIKGMISFDTITYIRENANSMDVLIELTTVDRWTKKDKATHVLLSFLVIDNQLKFAPSFRDISFFHYTLHELDLVNSKMRKAFKKKSPHYFSSSVTNMMPFEKKRKLGLKSLKGDILVAPQYDSISSFVADYALVKMGNRYNLLDKTFKPVFPKTKKHIKLENESYWKVSDESGKYSPYPEEEMVETVMMEEVISDTDYQSSKRNQDPAAYRRDSLSKVYYNRDYEIRRSGGQNGDPNVHSVVQNSTKETLATFTGFEFIDPHGPYLCGRRNDSTFVMTPTGKILFKSQFVCEYESPGYLQIFDRTTRLVGLYCPFTNVYIKPMYAYIEAIDRDRFFVVMTKKGKVGYLDAEGKQLFE